MQEEIKQPEAAAEVDVVGRAEQAAKRLEEANKKQEELMLAQEKIKARDMLGGRAAAGAAPPQVDPEVEKKQKMKDYFKGTAIEKMLK